MGLYLTAGATLAHHPHKKISEAIVQALDVRQHAHGRIVRRGENKKVYDLTARFLMQVSDFPFSQKKDIIDAVSRIYDMEVRAPVYIDNGPLEPEWS